MEAARAPGEKAGQSQPGEPREEISSLQQWGDKSVLPQPGDETIKFSDSTERDFLSIKS